MGVGVWGWLRVRRSSPMSLGAWGVRSGALALVLLLVCSLAIGSQARSDGALVSTHCTSRQAAQARGEAQRCTRTQRCSCVGARIRVHTFMHLRMSILAACCARLCAEHVHAHGALTVLTVWVRCALLCLGGVRPDAAVAPVDWHAGAVVSQWFLRTQLLGRAVHGHI